MGSSEFTSRYTAHVTEDTAVVPGGVVATSPLVGETVPGAVLPADRPQAETTSGSVTAAAAMTVQGFRLQPMCPPRYDFIPAGGMNSLLLIHDPALDPGLDHRCLADLIVGQARTVGGEEGECGFNSF